MNIKIMLNLADLVPSTTYYSNTTNDPGVLNFSSGICIFNSARGKVPSLSIPGYFEIGNVAGMRTGTSLHTDDTPVIIDGILYNINIGSYLNLNAFDFESITAISNTTALNFLGGANSGFFVLKSKTGEGFDKPRIEFNSYVTHGWANTDLAPPNQSTDNGEWYFANAVAYSRDLGSVDARISYTLQKQPTSYEGQPYLHNLRINTGLFSGARFNARLFLDGRYGIYNRPVSSRGSPNDVTSKTGQIMGNANLSVRYNLTDWLSVSSQAALISHTNNIESSGSTASNESTYANSRRQGNLFVNIDTEVLRKLRFSGFSGVQYVDQRIYIHRSGVLDFTGVPGYPPGYTEHYEQSENWIDKNPSVMAMASITYDSLIVLGSHWRTGTHSHFANDKGNDWAYSISSAFLFRKLLGMPQLSMGRIRMNFGAHTVVTFPNYPILDLESIEIPSNRINPYEVDNFEAGLDLGFLQDQVIFTFNYFNNRESYDVPENIINGLSGNLVNGWEIEARYTTSTNKGRDYETSLLFSRSKTRIDQFPSEEAYSDPMSSIRWFNSITYRSIVATALIESLQNYFGYQNIERVSFTKLRDISVGVKLPEKFLGKGKIHEVSVLLSGRNLLQIDGPSVDYEAQLYSSYSKSCSLSINVIL